MAEAGGPAVVLLSRSLKGKNIRNLTWAAEAGGPAVVPSSRKPVRTKTATTKTARTKKGKNKNS